MGGTNKRNTYITWFLWLLGIILAGGFTLFFLWRQGIWIPNAFRADDYAVKGIDVSAYQGEINWLKIEDQNMKFAFLKATEGSSFVDERFAYNWDEAHKTTLRVGAYHFFSYDSSGKTQAENFIRTVPKEANALPPVIDVEFYGDKEKNLPVRSDVEKELRTMIDMLHKHYGKRTIIYTTQKAYDLYIKNGFRESDIWIRDVFTDPSLPDRRNWVFWQYTDKEKLEGYNGKEKFIDVNVFHRSLAEFKAFGK